jgi:hypothetical protein
MKKTITFFIITLIFIGLTGFSANPAKSVLLRYNLKKDQTFLMKIKTNQNISMTMNDQDISIMQNVTLDQKATVTELTEAKSYVLDITYDRIQFNQNAMGMEITWDSDDKSENQSPMVQQIAGQLGTSIGKTIALEIDQNGNAISNNKTDVMGETNISGFETGMLVVFPDHEIKAGDSWEVTVKPDPSSDYTITSVYTLDEIKGKSAYISFEGTVTGTEAAGNAAKIDGSISGKSVIEIATGWLKEASVHQNLTMDLSMQGQANPMKLSSFIELTTE